MLIKNKTICAKIFDNSSYTSLARKLNYWRFKTQSIVFTNGCFDILHPGHIDYLSKAAQLGDVLVVGLNTDRSVSRIKGPDRPINNQDARAVMLAALFFVDAVILFDEDTPLSLITTIQPDVLVKGGDYRAEEIVGNDIVCAKNGKVIVIDLLPDYSTTNMIQKMTLPHGKRSQ